MFNEAINLCHFQFKIRIYILYFFQKTIVGLKMNTVLPKYLDDRLKRMMKKS